MPESTFGSSSAIEGFTGGKWQTEINVRDFIQKNFGKNVSICLKKNAKKAAFLIWIQKLFLQLHPTEQAI